MNGRKAIAWIVGLIWLSLILALIFFVKVPAEWVPVVLSIVAAGLLLTVAFIGGTVWKDWIKSVHFRTELYNGKE